MCHRNCKLLTALDCEWISSVYWFGKMVRSNILMRKEVISIVFFVGIWSWLADKLHFILGYEAQSPPSLLQDYSICNNARLISTQFLLQAFDPNEWCLKNGLFNGGLNPQPLSHDLTTRARLLALSSVYWFCKMVRRAILMRNEVYIYSIVCYN